jgi:hypothetical protein
MVLAKLILIRNHVKKHVTSTFRLCKKNLGFPRMLNRSKYRHNAMFEKLHLLTNQPQSFVIIRMQGTVGGGRVWEMGEMAYTPPPPCKSKFNIDLDVCTN